MILTIKNIITSFVIFAAVFNGEQVVAQETKFDPMNLDEKMRVRKKPTPLAQEELVKVLCSSHEAEFGKPPNSNKLALAWAQVSLENARGKKIWNNNLGNQGPFRMDQEYYYHLRNGWPYRSFPTPVESGRSYWKIIQRCQMALSAFNQGDPALAASALKSCGYYSQSTKEYTKVISSLYYEAKSKVVKDGCGQTKD